MKPLIFRSLATLTFATIAFSSHAQTNPNTQINWPLATGHGAPTAPCTKDGNPYFDLTNHIYYQCDTMAGWVPVGGGAGTGTVTIFTAPTANWPIWLVPTVTSSTTTPQLSVVSPSFSQNLFLATPNGSPGSLGPRPIASADLPLGTTSFPGALQPDGSTITVVSGVIHAPSAGMVWPTGSGPAIPCYTGSNSWCTSYNTVNLVPFNFLPSATNSQAGVMRPDGTSCTVVSGVLSCGPGGNAALNNTVRTVTASTSLNTSDGAVYVGTSSGVTLTLPGVTVGQAVALVNTSANPVTIAAGAGMNIGTIPTNLAAGNAVIVEYQMSGQWQLLGTTAASGTTVTLQTNNVNNTDQTHLNFTDTATVKFTNPSTGLESATVPATTINGQTCTPAGTCTIPVITTGPVAAATCQGGVAFGYGLSVLDNQAPSPGCFNSGASTDAYLAFSLTPSLPQFAQGTAAIPAFWNGTSIILYYTSTVNTGNFTWSVQSYCPAASGSTPGTPSYGTAVTSTVTVPGTIGQQGSVTLANIATNSANGCPATGNTIPGTMQFQISVTAGSATGGNVQLVRYNVETSRTQI